MFTGPAVEGKVRVTDDRESGASSADMKFP